MSASHVLINGQPSIHVAYDDIMTTDTEEELLTQMMECSSKLIDDKVTDGESTCDEQTDGKV